MEYTEDFLKKMVQCGTLGYPVSKIINVFDIDNEEQFVKDFDNKQSLVYKHYQKGIDKADFILDSKLFEMAKEGDLKALAKYEERKKNNINQVESERKEHKKGKKVDIVKFNYI